MSTLALPLPTAPLANLAPFGRPRPRPTGLLVIAGAHLLVIWALLQGDVLPAALRQAQPLVVALINDARPAPPADPALPVPRPPSAVQPAPQPLPPPEITVAAAPAAPVVVVAATVPAAQAAPPAPALAEPPPVRPATPTPAPVVVAPPAPRQLQASAIRYRTPPAIEVPMASRRLGESGTVLLRVLVDAQGVPRQITLHRSSGHARLDEQALAAMRQARFQPVTEDGAAVEWLVIAPLQYDVD